MNYDWYPITIIQCFFLLFHVHTEIGTDVPNFFSPFVSPTHNIASNWNAILCGNRNSQRAAGEKFEVYWILLRGFALVRGAPGEKIFKKIWIQVGSY